MSQHQSVTTLITGFSIVKPLQLGLYQMHFSEYLIWRVTEQQSLTAETCSSPLCTAYYSTYGCTDNRTNSQSVLLKSLLLAGAATQPLFSVILSQSIYLCTCSPLQSTLLQSAGQPPYAWRSVSKNSMRSDCGRT